MIPMEPRAAESQRAVASPAREWMPPAPSSLTRPPKDDASAQGRRSWGDRVFRGVTMVFALLILVIAAGIAWQLYRNSALARHAFGWAFLHKQIWDPVAE